MYSMQTDLSISQNHVTTNGVNLTRVCESASVRFARYDRSGALSERVHSRSGAPRKSTGAPFSVLLADEQQSGSKSLPLHMHRSVLTAAAALAFVASGVSIQMVHSVLLAILNTQSSFTN